MDDFTSKWLSIIVPVYKVEKYIQRCLDTLCGQLSSDVELILVDDGSPDRCPTLCDEYVEKYKTVSVIHQRNAGAAAARNAGLDAANGKLIAFIDPDDTVVNDFIIRIKEFSVQCKDGFAFSYLLKCQNDQGGDRAEENYHFPYHVGMNAAEAVLHLEKAASLNILWNKVYVKSVINLYPPIRFIAGSEPGEDMLFNCAYFTRVHEYAFLDASMYTYYRYGNIEGSLSHKFYPDLLEKTMMFCSARSDLYEVLCMHDMECQNELAK